MALALLFILLGLVLLVVGGDSLVRGATGLARLAGVSPAVIGLTVVAAGTSMPELVVSVNAALTGSPGLALGNVVGSNIFNIGAILGIAALIAPLQIEGNSVRLEWPVMLLSSALLHLLARDGTIDRLEGGFFTIGLVVFVAYTVRIARRDVSSAEVAQLTAELDADEAARTLSWPRALLYTALGWGMLAGGAQSLVHGAVYVADAAGVSQTVIGLTIVAAGTSLPELATSVVAALRGRDDIAVANVIGSNIFNVLGIMGVTATIRPLAVDPEITHRDDLWMLGLTLLLLPLMKSGMRIVRSEGVLLLAVFLAYMAVVVSGAIH